MENGTQPEIAGLREYTILIVDDEPKVLKELTHILSEAGFSVHSAMSGEAGLKLLKSVPAKLVISDQMMLGGMYGTEFLTKAKALYPDIVTMILSAYAEPDYILAATNEAKTFYYLTKPWEEEDLVRRVREALQFFHDGWTQKEQLKRANELLMQAERMAVLGTYAGGVAHNIRNMIVPVVNGLDSIRMDVEDIVEEKVKTSTGDSLKRLEENSREIFGIVESGEETIMQVSSLIECMMSLYRSHPKDPEVFDLAPVIDNAVRLEKTRKESKKIEFSVEKVGSDFTVEALKGPVSSTVVEFLKNASYAICKARPSGEGHVGIKLEETTDETLGKVLRLSIKDDGCGMSDRVRKDIFIPLFTTKADGGTGLGLSAAHQMIGEHNGRIEVESEEGKGTTFTVTLPKRKGEKRAER